MDFSFLRVTIGLLSGIIISSALIVGLHMMGADEETRKSIGMPLGMLVGAITMIVCLSY